MYFVVFIKLMTTHNFLFTHIVHVHVYLPSFQDLFSQQYFNYVCHGLCHYMEFVLGDVKVIMVVL